MITSILAFIVAFGLLVLVHEFGHFWVAKRSGITVEKFSIGFGPELLAWQGKETRYTLSLIPFGGFVKPQGETAEEVERQSGVPQPGDFLAASRWSRFLILIAGVLMNFVFAYVLFVRA